MSSVQQFDFVMRTVGKIGLFVVNLLFFYIKLFRNFIAN